MKKLFILWLLVLAPLLWADIQTDTIATNKGDLTIGLVGHGTLYSAWDDKVVHVDPWSRLADYTKLPKADLILITHEHGDHLDPGAVKAVATEETVVILTQSCADRVDGTVMKNGDVKQVMGMTVKAVPAYNVEHKRDNGQPFHPKGQGNGYVITFGDKTVYIAGDTENVPEMAELKEKVDIAFLPMNLPYTMSPEMAADAARAVAPDILYPYHFGDTNVQELMTLLDKEDIEIRIRNME